MFHIQVEHFLYVPCLLGFQTMKVSCFTQKKKSGLKFYDAQKITIWSMFNTLEKIMQMTFQRDMGCKLPIKGQVVDHNNVGIINNEGQRVYLVND